MNLEEYVIHNIINQETSCSPNNAKNGLQYKTATHNSEGSGLFP